MRRLQFGLCASLLSAVLVPGLVTAQGTDGERGMRVRWTRIVGIIEPEGIVGRRPGGVPCDLGVDCVVGAVAPWTVTDGSAEVYLHNGDTKFMVNGLVLGGDPSFTNIGTPGVVNMVRGTLVCNDTGPGLPELVDTDAVVLSTRGNARFHGRVDLPASCIDEPEDIAFLIRIADVSDPNFAGLIDLWNAFGAVRTLRPTALNKTDQD